METSYNSLKNTKLLSPAFDKRLAVSAALRSGTAQTHHKAQPAVTRSPQHPGNTGRNAQHTPPAHRITCCFSVKAEVTGRKKHCGPQTASPKLPNTGPTPTPVSVRHAGTDHALLSHPPPPTDSAARPGQAPAPGGLGAGRAPLAPPAAASSASHSRRRQPALSALQQPAGIFARPRWPALADKTVHPPRPRHRGSRPVAGSPFVLVPSEPPASHPAPRRQPIRRNARPEAVKPAAPLPAPRPARTSAPEPQLRSYPADSVPAAHGGTAPPALVSRATQPPWPRPWPRPSPRPT
ncbi:uncharacterized protein LOC133278658 [Pezoporus flaviventris]|uniref:uncharacterized protein LOC133278658 n=1 Tax=Pezoporus flaviventris TaxID=889875 RepID=UPI002AB24FAF|nr:uncharacterized protein LOC133278658 [Pezoporus flaviventris]